MKDQPQGPQASRLRQRKFKLVRRFQLPDDLLPGSLSQSHLRCGKPTCHCADGPGHPVWSLTFMVNGKKHVQHIPKDWVEDVRRRVEAGREFQDAVREVLAANAQLLVLAASRGASRDEGADAASPQKYVGKCLGLKSYLQCPGDGRTQGRIPAAALLWGLIMGVLLRRAAFAGIEALVRSRARRALDVSPRFGDDALGYFTARLDPEVTRRAAVTAVRQAKRHKAFDSSRFIGLALDGTGAGRSHDKVCDLCRPYRNQKKQIQGYHHQLVMLSVVGTGLTLPVDIEPYGPGDSEYSAARRLLPRTVKNLGPRFANYLVADGEFARAPFLHDAGDLGLFVIIRLKNNLPALFAAAQQRFRGQPPHQVFSQGPDRVEIWDANDFDPWDTLRWETVRVIRYRQYKPNGKVYEAYWLTDFPPHLVSRQTLFLLAKSRWEIENQGFNDAKNRYGFEHICHHQPHSLRVVWLLICLALTIERLYRVRYLHRGTHPVRAAIELLLLFQLSLGSLRDTRTDSS